MTMNAALMIASLLAVSAQRKRCLISGDPHVQTFDTDKGYIHHPMFAPGAWWLVNTESGDFQAQAMYSMCGTRVKRGWMGWKELGNTSAHCVEQVAVSSKHTEHQAVVVQPPCTWNWGQMKCESCSADKMPRVLFNGEKFECAANKWNEVATDVKIHCNYTHTQLKFGSGAEEVHVAFFFFGGPGMEPAVEKTCTGRTHGNLHMWMEKQQFGPQCGHCGDFDGDAENDKRMFGYDGRLLKEVADRLDKSKVDLCDADVKDCESLFLTSATPKRYNSNGHVIKDEELCGCAKENACKASGETRVDVEKACADAYKKVCKVEASPLQDAHKDFFEECMSDVCNGGLAFTEIDVEAEQEAECSENEAMKGHPVCTYCKTA